ncbi:MAG: transporter substrate-binding domain-containing protein [Planctomycetes bacterium]|nr:transporter substrate-binding domain-containing protein [Planctomycetota bacterium]
MVETMTKRGLNLLAAAALAALLASPPATGQEEERVLRVATKPFPPLVLEKDGVWSGFSIDLWDAVAADLGVRYEWVGKEKVQELLDAVGSGEADVAIAGITITAERERALDFSHPYYESGLQVMIAEEREGSFLAEVLALFSPAILEVLGVIAVAVLVSAHIVWFFERRANPQQFPKGYFRGVWEAIWWSVVTLSTVGYGDRTPAGVPGRLIAMVWIFIGIVLVAFFTATVTSSLTVERLEGGIAGPDDLPGRTVGTAPGTTAARWLEENGATVREFAPIEDAYAALVKGDVEAVVYDAPVLLHHASHAGKGRVLVVGPLFEKQLYGIAVGRGSELREKINLSLLGLEESRKYESIHDRWFRP